VPADADDLASAGECVPGCGRHDDRTQQGPEQRPEEIRTTLINDTNLSEHLIASQAKGRKGGRPPVFDHEPRS
jgi:hypothetical protein